MLQNRLRHTLGKIDCRVVFENIDTANELTFDTGLIGNGTNDFARFNALFSADSKPEALHDNVWVLIKWSGTSQLLRSVGKRYLAFLTSLVTKRKGFA